MIIEAILKNGVIGFFYAKVFLFYFRSEFQESLRAELMTYLSAIVIE